MWLPACKKVNCVRYSDWKRSLRWETGVNKNAHCGVRLRNWHRKGKGTVRLEPSWLRISQSSFGLSASKDNVHAVFVMLTRPQHGSTSTGKQIQRHYETRIYAAPQKSELGSTGPGEEQKYDYGSNQHPPYPRSQLGNAGTVEPTKHLRCHALAAQAPVNTRRKIMQPTTPQHLRVHNLAPQTRLN